MTESTTKRASQLSRPTAEQSDWQEHHGNVYRCQVHLTCANGIWSAAATMLPGVSASGGCEQEVLVNVKAALSTAVASHITAGRTIPWIDSEDEVPSGTIARWVIFSVCTTSPDS